MAHADSQEVPASDLGRGSVCEHGADVVPMVHDEIFHARVALAQPLRADVFLANLVAEMADLEAAQTECSAGQVVERVARAYGCNSISKLLVELLDECWFRSVKPVVDGHAFEVVFELVERPEHLVDAVVEACNPKLID